MSITDKFYSGGVFSSAAALPRIARKVLLSSLNLTKNAKLLIENILQRGNHFVVFMCAKNNSI